MKAALLLFILATTLVQAATVEPPRCEYLKDPFGIDVSRPRLSWILSSSRRGEMQSAYRVLVASSVERLAQEQGDLWDSGKVSSDQSFQVEYAGKPLISRTACFWKVRIWNDRGQSSPWSRPASWSMGLLQPGDWQAKWIGTDDSQKLVSLAGAQWIWVNEGNPALSAPLGKRYFRRTITLPAGQKPARATCVITADNAFGLSINGQKAAHSDNWEQPVTLDVTPLLAQRIEPMRAMETICPVAITNPAPGAWIVGMGQNFYGTVRLKASAPRGTQVRLTSAYSLKPDGLLKTADNRSARCTDVYTFKGKGKEVWSPRFKGQGYRRVQVTGFPGTPTLDNFEGRL